MLHVLILLQLGGFNVEVFYASSSSPSINIIQSESVQYYDLDAPSNVENEINSRLGAMSEKTAASEFSRFQNSSEGAALIETLTDSYSSIARATQLGLTHVPAVVIDGHSVVYGTTNVSVAIKELTREN